MRVPDLIAHNPVFLVVEVESQERPIGTAFVLNVRSGTTNHGYLVTAAHVVRQASRLGPIAVRVNRRRHPGPVNNTPDAWEVDGSETFGPLDGWLFHEDPSNDVAVVPFMAPAEQFMFVSVEDESCATREVIERERIGIGDDVVVAGLFAAHVGRDVNRPIVRGGIIAAMPDEPLRDTLGGLSYEAYLAEVRSVGGLSGSPAWVVINPARVTPGSTTPERRLHFYLLGLIRGHWKKEGEWLADVVSDETDVMNTGIAIVTPIRKARDIIYSDDEIERRYRVDQQIAAGTADA